MPKKVLPNPRPAAELLDEVFAFSDADAKALVQNLGIYVPGPTIEWTLEVTKYL